jgi:hypothetical protein
MGTAIVHVTSSTIDYPASADAALSLHAHFAGHIGRVACAPKLTSPDKISSGLQTKIMQENLAPLATGIRSTFNGVHANDPCPMATNVLDSATSPSFEQPRQKPSPRLLTCVPDKSKRRSEDHSKQRPPTCMSTAGNTTSSSR